MSKVIALLRSYTVACCARSSPALSWFDLDRHLIPARGAEPEHWHYDLRFMIEADPMEPLVVSSESKELAWVDIDRVEN